MEAIPQPVANSIGFLKFFKFLFLGIFIILLLLSATYNSMHEKSLTPFVTTIGQKLSQSTTELSTASKMVIEQQGYYQKTPDFWTGFFRFIKINANFYLSFYTIYMWLFIFSWLISKSPFSDSTKTFQNYFFALILFFVLQAIFVLGMAAATEKIDCFAGCDHSSMGYFFSPFTAFKDFFMALDYMIRPLVGITEKVNNVPLTNTNTSNFNDLNNITNMSNG